MTDSPFANLIELDERESNGIRLTLLSNRALNQASVLVSDERSSEAFAHRVRASRTRVGRFGSVHSAWSP